MMKYVATLIILVTYFSGASQNVSQKETSGNTAKNSQIKYQPSKISLSLGAGYDHGGIGTKFTRFLTDDLGLFAGVGYNIVTIGYSVGAEFRLNENISKFFTPYLAAWYGTNANLKLRDRETNGIIFEKVYYGTSVAIGFRYKLADSNSSLWDIGIIFPFRNEYFFDDIEKLKSIDPSYENNYLPISIKLAYIITLK